MTNARSWGSTVGWVDDASSLRVRGRPGRILLIDSVVAVACLAVMMYAWVPLPAMVIPFVPYAIASTIICVCLALRRRFAVPALLGLVCGLVLHMLVVRELTVATAIGACVGAYTVQVHTRGPWRTGFNVALIVGPVLAILRVPRVRLSDWESTGLVLIGVWGLLAICVLLGVLRRHRLVEAERLLEQVRQEEILRAREARLADLAERTHIAREMHDLIAHSLGVIVAQADGGRYAARTRPAAATQALTTIGTLGRESMAEMRRLIGVLREEADRRDASPAPTLADLPALIADYRQAGLRVHLTETGAPSPVPSGLGLTGYRVVQESLSNVLRHAGPTVAAVRLGWQPAMLAVTVTNLAAEPPPAAESGTGHGLIGMRERVRLHGGTLAAGPAGDGWRVHAELPLPREGT